MRSNWVREKLRAGTPSVGSFLGLGSPLVGEMLAHAGFDWLVIETEHKGGLVTEDDSKHGKDQVQELTKQYETKVDELIEKKRQEVLQV